jgi:hypothetical protein
MKASQLTAFEARAHATDVGLTPMSVTVDGQVYQGSGTHAGHKHVRLLEGGEAQNREAHFTISKQLLPAAWALHTIVEIAGEIYQVRKVWGHDAVDPVWSFRLEQWME